MANRLRQAGPSMNLADVPGAKESGAQWLMACGFQNRAEALKAAKRFMENVKRLRKMTASERKKSEQL